MSDPVTNVEIEDVLSSIRRLVSNEERPRKAQDEAPAIDEEKAVPEADKLVLTPFFRVDDHADTQSGDAQTEDAAADETRSDDTQKAVTQPEDDAPATVEDQIDSAEEEKANDSDAGLDEASAEPAETSPDWDDSAPETSEADSAWDVEDTEDGAEDAAPEDIAPDMSDSRDALKARVAELEQVVARRDDQWEPDGTTDDAYSGGPVAAVPWEDYEPDADDSNGKGEAAEAEVAKPTEPETTSKLREVTPPAPVDDIPENFVAEEPRETDDETSIDAGLLAETDDILDEDALRDLVADIVRQELQGALGERITRNVRKLVRREIARALASQDLD